VEFFEEPPAQRTRAVARAEASVRAEGLEVSDEARAILARWARGEVSVQQMRRLVWELHGLPLEPW
jgi:Antitoxin VbhA